MSASEHRNYARRFLTKAEQYLASAQDNLTAGRFTPAAGDAVHAGISAKDAIVTVLTGATQRRKDHARAAKELGQSLGKRPEATTAERALRELIAAKGDVEYGTDLVDVSEAKQLIRRAGTLVETGVDLGVRECHERGCSPPSFDALDPAALGRFWSGVLGRELVDNPRGGVTLLPNEATDFRIRFVPTDVPKTGRNQMHFDLTSSSLDEQHQTVERALALGGRHYDVGQLPEEEHVVLADPEGNEFCVIEPGNGFLAGCGFIGVLSSDGSQSCGYFWTVTSSARCLPREAEAIASLGVDVRC